MSQQGAFGRTSGPGVSVPASVIVDPFPNSSPSSAHSWSLQSPSTWPKWLVALIIGVPLTIGGAYWIYSQQRWKPAGGKRGTEKGGPVRNGKRPHIGAGDSASGLPNSSSNSLKEPKTVPEKIAYLKNEGNKLFRAKRYMDARQCYTEAIDLATQNNTKDLDLAQSLQNRAACNEQLKHFEDVISDCTSAIKIDKQYAKAYARRSRGRERCGLLQDAVHDLVAASILTNFQNNDYRERSEKLLNQLSTKIAQDVISNRKTGTYKPKLSRTFLRQFNHGFTQDPINNQMKNARFSDPQWPIDFALQSLADGQYDAVMDFCTDALESGPDDKQILARLLRGTMYFLYGNAESAKVDLNFVIKSDDASLKEKSNARIKLACLLLQEQVDPEAILSRLTDAAELDPSNPDILFHRAQCYMLFSQFDECLKDFRKCRDLQGNNDPTCSFHIAHIEFRIRMSQSPMDPRPLAQLEEQISPLGSSEAYVLLGQLYMEMREFEKADTYYKRAVADNEDDSHNAVVFTQQAMLEMMWREDRQAAGNLLAKARDVDANYSPALELMMDLELQAGNLEGAKGHYERCLELAKSEVEMVNVVQAYQIGEAGHWVYADLGIEEQNPLRGF